jgi:transposase
MLVPDNLRSAVTKPDPYETQINATFEDMAALYGCVVVPARSGRPKDKALDEKAVELVYKRVIAPLRHRSFTRIEELNEAYWEILDALNGELMQRSGFSRRHRFRAHERDELKPLPHERYVFRRFRELKVAFNYHIYLRDDGHHYSVPYGYRGKRVRVAVSYDTVEIFSDRTRIATHRRDQTRGGYSTKREHMPDHHREYAEWNPGRFLSWTRRYGPQTKAFIEQELNRRHVPEQNYRNCMGILKLARSYGSDRMEAACRRALHYNLGGYRAAFEASKASLQCNARPAQLQPRTQSRP